MRVPMLALFELASASKQEKVAAGGDKLRFSETFTTEDPFPIDAVPIDEGFLHKYNLQDLPYLKSGDLIFVAMARVDDDILITGDDKQLMRAREAGVRALKIEEFLAG